ncbi:hypothetical protein [Gordonia cholesterolivorans]|uniref:Uncharacterized protein n=1 Tax=Gordonia cholesterolivorans TaxID=559625 RepID=A0ABP5UBL8_9ACTN
MTYGPITADHIEMAFSADLVARIEAWSNAARDPESWAALRREADERSTGRPSGQHVVSGVQLADALEALARIVRDQVDELIEPSLQVRDNTKES